MGNTSSCHCRSKKNIHVNKSTKMFNSEIPENHKLPPTKEEKEPKKDANQEVSLAVNCIDLIDDFMNEPEKNIKKIYNISSQLAQINVIVLVLLQLTCDEKSEKREALILHFLKTILEEIQKWKNDQRKKTYCKKLISEILPIVDEYYPEIQNKNDPIILSLIKEIYIQANLTYASLRNLPDYSTEKTKLDCMRIYLNKLRAQLEGTINRINIDDNLDRKKGLSKLHAKYLKELLEALNTTSNEEVLFESIRNCRFDKRKFIKLSHSIIMGADGGIYVLLNKVTTEEYELLAESPDLNYSLKLMIEEKTGKIIIGEGSFGKIRIVMAIIPNEKQNNSLIEGKIVCVKKAGRKKKNKKTEDIWSSTWNDYCSIEFLDDAPEIYDIKINKDSQNKLQGYCFQKLLMFPNGQKIFEDSNEENIKKFKEYHNWSHVKNYVLGILTLMIQLHNNGICMTDLKPANTLYDKESKTTKLVDLAGAVRVKSKNQLKSCKNEDIKEYSQNYTAPELNQLIEDEDYETTIDLPKCISWTVGNILSLIINKIPRYEFEPIEKDVVSLINHLKEKNRDDRISLEEGLKRLKQISDFQSQETSKNDILTRYVDLLKTGFRKEDESIRAKLNLKNDIYYLCRVFNNKLKITADNPDKYDNYVYDPEADKTIKDLIEELKCMLNQRDEDQIFESESIRKEVLILFGSAGSGKSSALQKLFIEAVQEWKPGMAIPIFMNLAIDQDLKSYMSSLMSSLGIKDYHFESMLTTPLNLFFDSLDESRIKDGPRFIQSLFKDLSSYKNEKYSIKMIVTCRTGYFDENCFEKEIKKDQIKINMRLRFIIPLDYFFFNDSSNLIELIELYLAQNGEADKIKEKVIQFLETIKEYDLNKLMKTTYMIFIILNILPELKKQKNSSSIEYNNINLLTIYRMYLKNNVLKEIQRSSIEAIKTKSVEVLLKIGTVLAEKMMQTEKATNELKGKDVFNFLLSPTLTQLLGKEYRTKLGFIENKEIYEIMRTLNLNMRIEKKNDDENINLSFPHENIKTFFAVNGFIERMHNSDAYPEWLETKLFVDDHNLVSFMIEAFKNESHFAKKAEIAILETKGQPSDCKVSVRAANLITFLVASNYSFFNRDLSHIKIKGANLSDGIFNKCNFDHADLSEVTLNNVKIDRASFHNTNFSKAKIDNFPPLYGHSQSVNSAEFSADGKRIVSGSDDKTIRIWDVETGKELKKYDGHSESINSVAFSADGKRIVSGSDDKTVRIWDVETGKEEKKYEGHSETVNSVAFSADGKRIVSGSDDKTVRIWDVETGKELKKYEGHSKSVNSVAFSADGKRIVSGSDDESIRIWDVETGKELKKYEGHSKSVNSVAFSVDGKKIVSGSIDFTVRMWDVETGKEEKKYMGNFGYVHSVAYSADGKKIVSCDNKTVRIRDVKTGKELKIYKEHSEQVNSVAFSADGKKVVSSSLDQTVRIWDVDTGKELKKYEGHSDYVNSVAYSPDGKRIASCDKEIVRIWDVETGTALKKFEEQTRSVAFSPDGKKIVSGGGDKTILIWDVETGKKIKNYEGHSGSVNSAEFSADGKRIVSGSDDESIRIWDVETGKELKKYEGHSKSVNSVAFSADGKRIVSGSFDKTVRLWDVETGKELKKYEGHLSFVNSVCFSPDRKRILSGSFDNTVRIWDVETGKELKIYEGHSEFVLSIAYSADGKRIASSSRDKTIRIWDVETGKELKKYEGHSHSVNSVAFSADCKRIVTGSVDRSIRIWDVESHSESVISVADGEDYNGTSLIISSNKTEFSCLNISNFGTCLNCPDRLNLFFKQFKGKS